MAAQNTHFFAWSAYFRTRSPPKRDADSAKTRSETARFFVCIVFSFPFSTKAHRRPRLHCALFRPSVRRRAIAASPRLQTYVRQCTADRAQTWSETARFFARPCVDVRISPGGGVLFKTKDERRKTGRLRPPHSAETARKNPPPHPTIVRKLELSTFLPPYIPGTRFLPFHFSRFLHAF